MQEVSKVNKFDVSKDVKSVNSHCQGIFFTDAVYASDGISGSCSFLPSIKWA